MDMFWQGARRCGSNRAALGAILGVIVTIAFPFHSAAQAPLPALAVGSHGSQRSTVRDAANTDTERADIQKRLAACCSTIDELTAASKTVPEYLDEQQELLKWLEVLLSQRAAIATQSAELQSELSQTQQQLESLQTLGAAPSGRQSFLELDDARDDLTAEQARSESIEMKIDSLKASLGLERDAFDASEKARRAAHEALETASTSKAKEFAAQQHTLAKLRSRTHRETLWQKEHQLENAKLEQQASSNRREALECKVRELRQTATFTEEDLRSRLAHLDKAEVQLQKQLAEIQSSARDNQQQWLQAKQALDVAAGHKPELVEAVTTWKLAWDLRQERVALMQEVLAYVSVVRTSWRRRYELANRQASVETVEQWGAELAAFRAQLARFKRLVEIKTDERMSELASVQKRIIRLSDDEDAVARLIQRQASELEEVIAAYGAQLALVKTGERLTSRFAEEVSEVVGAAAASHWLTHTGEFLAACWNYEIATIDDRPVTVRKIVMGFVVLLIGVLLSRVFSRMLGRRILPRVGLNQGASTAIESVSFYLMLTCSAFVVLELVNLPLTVFAFMGGAIAIGVGFGSQNILNNFISGLILMAERPIRVGDLVDIEGLNGTVEQIGARSTRVRTGTNLEIIVPNSKFLENNVTNWTLSSTEIRTMVSVGAAYGSPTRKVSSLLRKAVEENERVLANPAPIILFKGFGDDALLFEAHFWVRMRTMMQAEEIASEVRHTIDDLFEEAGITIAFPQRDVHIDASAPIEVNVRRIDDRTQLAKPQNRAA
jgi:small-conductance mechanosensitive channel